jgi:hypothetical protein
MDAKELALRYKSAVEEGLGLLAKLDDDNDVIFKHPDLGTFLISLDAKNDPEYMMLVFPNFADKDLTGGDKPKLLELINKVNRTCKAVKIGMRDGEEGNVVATIECILAAPNEAPSQELLNSVMKRNMSAMRAAVETLIRLAKEKPNSEEPNSEM